MMSAELHHIYFVLLKVSELHTLNETNIVVYFFVYFITSFNVLSLEIPKLHIPEGIGMNGTCSAVVCPLLLEPP